jgi:hypothetical protein
MESAIYKSELKTAVCAYVDLPARQENTKEHNHKGIFYSFRKSPRDTVRVTSRAFRGTFLRHRQAITGQHLQGPLAIRSEKVQPYLKRVQTLSGIKIGHVLLSKETGNAECIEFCFGNVCFDGIVEMLEYDYFFIFLLHGVPGISKRQRFALDKKRESTTFADEER